MEPVAPPMPSEPAPIAPEELLAHAGFLARLARELTRDADRAADLVQETYRVALERPPRGGEGLRGWLATVAANLARNRHRGDRRRGAREAAAARAEALQPDALALERLEVQRELVELLLALPPEQRTVLHLRYFEGLAPRAIAARLGAPLKTVKARQTRALATLRARLDARSGGDRSKWLAALVPLARSVGPGAGVLLGGMAMKKTITVVAVLLVALAAWRGWRMLGLPERGTAGAGRGADLVAASLETPPAPLADPLAPELVPEREALEAAPEVAAETGALEITLRRADGTPAADVPIAILCAEDRAPRAEYARVRTDADGRALAAELAPGAAWIWAGGQRFDATVAAASTRAVTFTLAEAFRVAGTVVDESGATVAGAEIWVEASSERWPGGFLAARSGSDGGFALRDVHFTASVGARKRGHVASQCFTPAQSEGDADGTRTMRLVLAERGGGLRGRVLAPDGSPIAGAEVLAGPDGGAMSAEWEGLTPEPAFAVTDADGTFELGNDLPPGPQPVHVAARGFPVFQGEVEVVAGRTAELEVRLEPPARIVGRLVDVHGMPVAGARVLASVEERGGWYHDRFQAPTDRTDADGRFTLEWVAPGTRELNAYSDDHLGRARARVECVAGETATCQLALELGHTITGRVVDGTGQPLARWLVDSRGSFGWWYPRQARTDADGRFVLANLGDGSHDLTVRDDYASHPRAQVPGIRVGTADLEIVVADAGVAKGVLRARLVAPGESLANLTATLWKEGANEGHFLDVDPQTGAIETEVFPGLYRLAVSRGTEEVVAGPAVEVEPDRVTDLGDLEIEAGGRVEVELVGLPADALARLSLELVRDGADAVRLAPADGPRISPEVMPGTWLLAADELALDPDVVEVLPGRTTRVVVAVSPAVRIALHLVDESRDSIRVEAFDAAGRRRLERTYRSREQADFRAVLALPPGPARIVVTTRAGRRAEVELDVQHGRAPDAVIELEPR